MSPSPSAVPLDAADSPIAPAAGAHDLHDAVEKTMGEATHAIAATVTASLNSASQQDVQRPPDPPNISHPLHQQNPHDPVGLGVGVPCVTTFSSAHDPSIDPADALKEGDNHDPGIPPNESAGNWQWRWLHFLDLELTLP